MYRWVALGTYNLCYFPLHILKTYGKDIFTPQFKFHHPSFFPLPLLCFWMQQNYDSIVLGTHVIVIPLHFFKLKKILNEIMILHAKYSMKFLLSILYIFYIKLKICFRWSTRVSYKIYRCSTEGAYNSNGIGKGIFIRRKKSATW